VSGFTLVDEERLKAYARERAEQLLRRLVDDWVRILRGHIDAAEKHYRYYYGVPIQLTTQMFVEEDSVKMVVEARIPPEVKERVYKVVEREVVKSAGETSIRLRILRNILLNELRSATGEAGALLHSHGKSAGKSIDQVRRSGETVRDQEGGPDTESINEGAL
jgi:hypothetical protein